MSAIITPLGVVSQSMAAQFDVDITVTTALFSYLTTGILCGTFLSMFAYSIVSIRRLNVAAGTTLAAALSGIWLVNQFFLLPFFFVLVGISCGLLLAAAVIVLTHTYSERTRARALLVTDSCYSGAGVVAGYAAGQLIESGFHWGSTYAVAIVASILLAIVAMRSDYPDPTTSPFEHESVKAYDRWPAAVFVVGIALLVYVLSFIFIYSWVPAYATEKFGASFDEGGSLVGRFFLGLFVGQIAAFLVSFRIGIRTLISCLLFVSTVSTLGLWNSSSLTSLATAMLVLGLVSGGVLKTLLSYGTMLVSTPSTTMISFLVLCTAIGSSLGPATSAAIVHTWGTESVLISTTLGFSTVLILVLMTMPIGGASQSHADHA